MYSRLTDGINGIPTSLQQINAYLAAYFVLRSHCTEPIIAYLLIGIVSQ